MVKRKSVREFAGVPYMHSSGSSSYHSSRSGAKRRKLLVLAPDSQPPPQPTFRERAGNALSVVNAAQAGRTVGGLVGLATGGFAGERVGEVAGGFIGGVGQALLLSRNKKNQKMARSLNRATNAAVNRTTMAKSGKAKVKREKTVKVSPYLRKAVKQVMNGTVAKGYYERQCQGVIGTVTNQATSDFSLTVTGGAFGTNQLQVYSGSSSFQTDYKSYFNHICYAPEQVAVGGAITKNLMSVVPGGEMNYFVPGKIWHAASVLFNNKVEEANPYATKTANLKTVFNVADGNLPSTQAGFLKINVLSSKVVFNLKNLSNRTLQLEIYECVSTVMFNPKNPLLDILETQDKIQDGTEDNLIGYFSAGQALSSAQTRVICEGKIDGFSIVCKNGAKWKYVKRTMILQPQEQCVHTMIGPSGVLDFKKLYRPGAAAGTAGDYFYDGAVKGWTKCVVMAVRPDPALISVPAPTEGAPTNYNQTAFRYVNIAGSANGSLQSLIAVEAEESYNLAVPEIAGFTTPPITVAGGVVPSVKLALNSRKPKIQITNLNFNQSRSAIPNSQIVVAREENPTASSSQFT